MDEKQFWQIVDSTRELAKSQKRRQGEDFIDAHIATLTAALEKLPTEQIVAFNDRFWDCHQRAYDWNLWAAAYWLGGGCSDDGFLDFRACLISLGKDLFTRAVANADALAEIADRDDIPGMQAEGFQYVASGVYKKITGENISLDGVPYPGLFTLSFCES